jgi:hypothetical protein
MKGHRMGQADLNSLSQLLSLILASSLLKALEVIPAYEVSKSWRHII